MVQCLSLLVNPNGLLTRDSPVFTPERWAKAIKGFVTLAASSVVLGKIKINKLFE